MSKYPSNEVMTGETQITQLLKYQQILTLFLNILSKNIDSK